MILADLQNILLVRKKILTRGFMTKRNKKLQSIINRLNDKNKRMLKRLVSLFLSIPFGRNLSMLARIYGTDKIGEHHYTEHYQNHLKKFKYKNVNLLEIGVGGYENPNWGGESLRMWKRYFCFGKIFGLDIYDKSSLEENRIKIFKGDQTDNSILDSIISEVGEFDIIIDDGSHINQHVIKSFQILFPYLKIGGIYIVEDTQTSYWADYGGTSKDFSAPNTTMNFFKSLTDSMNNQEFELKNYAQNYYDKTIISMHFYHNIIFIYKGKNDELSNILRNNEHPEPEN